MTVAIARQPDPPPPLRRGGRQAIYRFADLAIGDTITVQPAQAHSARTRATRYKRLHLGWNYTARSYPDKTVIWRTA